MANSNEWQITIFKFLNKFSLLTKYAYMTLTLLCLIVVGGFIAFFQNFHPKMILS